MPTGDSRQRVLVLLEKFLRERGPAYGLESLACFGSVARGQDNESSDIDIVYRKKSNADLSLVDLSLMREELVALLGREVDLIEERETLPERFRDRMKREAFYV